MFSLIDSGTDYIEVCSLAFTLAGKFAVEERSSMPLGSLITRRDRDVDELRVVVDIDLVGSTLVCTDEIISVRHLHLRHGLSGLVVDVAADYVRGSQQIRAQKQRREGEKYFFHHFLTNSATHPPPLAIFTGSSSPASTVNVSIL